MWFQGNAPTTYTRYSSLYLTAHAQALLTRYSVILLTCKRRKLIYLSSVRSPSNLDFCFLLRKIDWASHRNRLGIYMTIMSEIREKLSPHAIAVTSHELDHCVLRMRKDSKPATRIVPSLHSSRCLVYERRVGYLVV